ncbi:MAG: YaiI/YqxD family protein [Granulosicoccaceae bacterium]
MTIWVDADACPGAIREILFKASQRTKIPLTLVANHTQQTPRVPWISFVQVASGFDVADDEIVKRVQPGDLVITGDVPLAAEVVEKKALALNPRGELYSEENIKQRLNMRDFMDTMRSSGIQSGGPAAMGPRERQAFANQLDKYLAKAKPPEPDPQD